MTIRSLYPIFGFSLWFAVSAVLSGCGSSDAARKSGAGAGGSSSGSGGSTNGVGGNTSASGGAQSSSGGVQGSLGGATGMGGSTGTGAGTGTGGVTILPIDASFDGGCGPNFTAIIRDFKASDEPGGHPDFQGYGWIRGITPGIVMPDLGADQKPVYNGTGPIVGSMNRQQTTGPEAFNQWYRNTPCAGQNVVTCPPGQDSVNLYTEFVIPIQAVPGQLATYDNAAFFPIDNQLFGNYSTYNHNFHFTTELHTTFLYSGGEIFRFTGDDDLWVFINGKLAIDLGGIHSSASQQVDLDARAVEFGITIGTEYPLDLFHAERHTTESHFRIDTSIGFTNCAPIIILY